MDVSLVGLWLPILLSAVITFIVSAIVWMGLPHHKSDFSALSDEEGAMAKLRASGVAPGNMYMLPYAATQADAATDEFKARVAAGPVGILRVQNPSVRLSMGPTLGKTFVFYLVVGVFVAYVASRTLPAGTEYLRVFQITSTLAFMTHAGGSFSDAIWFGLPWRVAWKNAFDSLLYGLFVGGVFGWLWP